MTRRRTPGPTIARDWRAVAAGPSPGKSALPTAALAERTSDVALDAVRDRDIDAVVIRVRRRADGVAYALVVASAVFEQPADVRAVARRLDAAADALEGIAP